MQALKNRGMKLKIISHKTKWPYRGPKYNLHEAAIRWLQINKLVDSERSTVERKDIFFANSIEEKVSIIQREKCTYFVDDLPKVLKLVKKPTKTVLYDPKGIHSEEEKNMCWRKIENWEQIINQTKNQ